MASRSFNIKETINKNIDKHQFPAFNNHRSLVGWCSMNYPKALQNPIYMTKDTSEAPKYELDSLFQLKKPSERQFSQFTKPFTNVRQERSISAGEPKKSCLTLATVSHDVRARIFEENNRGATEFSTVRPLTNILGPNMDGNFERKVRQIGEIYYNLPNQGEEMRHLKKMPNTVLTEENLLTIMDDRLEFLDLQHKSDISNELINKIGYLAPKIKQLILTAVLITDDVLVELGRSCKYLHTIDISHCEQITEVALLEFVRSCRHRLRIIRANHLEQAMTDNVIAELAHCPHLEGLSINFCSQVTGTNLELLCDKQFSQLRLSSLPQLKGDDLGKIISRSATKLQHLDLSFGHPKEISNSLLARVGMCLKLRSLILTGCEGINDDGMTNLIYGEKAKGKPTEGLPVLETLKVGGLIALSDKMFQLIKRCPQLYFLEANNLEKLTDLFLDQLKTHVSLKMVLINFTPNITDEKIKEVQGSGKGLKIVRNIVRMTDPADDGLRMPIPLASMKIKKPKKKKK